MSYILFRFGLIDSYLVELLVSCCITFTSSPFYFLAREGDYYKIILSFDEPTDGKREGTGFIVKV